jgi:SulP family sulfate permease
VPFIDATGLQTFMEIVERFERRSVRVMLSGIRPSLRETLQRAGILQRVGEANVCASLAEIAQRLNAVEVDSVSLKVQP